MSKSSTISFLASKLPGTFTKESIESLVMNNSITFADAKEALSSIESITPDKGATDSTKVQMVEEAKMATEKDAMARLFAGIKFQALLKEVQDDDTLAYQEFVNLDNARNKIIADIVAKHEPDFNILLQEIKTTGGTNAEAIDKLITTKLGVANVE